MSEFHQNQSPVVQKGAATPPKESAEGAGTSMENQRPEALQQMKLAQLANAGSSAHGTLQREEKPGESEKEEKPGDDLQGKLYQFLATVEHEDVKGYKAKKAHLISEGTNFLSHQGVGDDQIQELVARPLIDHRLDMLTRGSKAQKLAEGIEVQIIQGEKYNAFLNNIGKLTGGEVHAAPLKNYARMKVKEEGKYDGDIGRIKDVIRASFIFEDEKQIEAAQTIIEAQGNYKVLEVKNRFKVTDDQLSENLNYRDVIYIVETDSITGKPVKIELQLHLHSLHEAKTKIKASFKLAAHHQHVMGLAPKLGLNKAKIKDNQYTGHDFYKVIRELTKSENALDQEVVEAAKQQSRAIYGGAWDKYKEEEKN